MVSRTEEHKPESQDKPVKPPAENEGETSGATEKPLEPARKASQGDVPKDMQLGTSEERVLETGGGERDERREDRIGREVAVVENTRDKKPQAVDETSSKLQPIVVTVFSLETHAKWEARSVSAVGRILGSDPNSTLTIHHIQMCCN